MERKEIQVAVAGLLKQSHKDSENLLRILTLALSDDVDDARLANALAHQATAYTRKVEEMWKVINPN